MAMEFKHFIFALLAGLSLMLQLVHAQDQSGFISIASIELRPLKNTTYVTKSGSLALFLRVDVGSISSQSYRYPYDVYDRLWKPIDSSYFKSTDISTSLTIDSQKHNDFQPPSVVMSTAVTPVNGSGPIEFSWDSDAPSALSGAATYDFSIMKTENSTLPPIVNAIEIYSVKYLLQSESDQGDVDAMAKIKSTYGIKRNWTGDPCAPQAYKWEGLNCSYVIDGSSPPRITSLNLSSSGLIGEISADISSLVMLQYLDLSNNNLTGSVPDFLSQLQYLRVLNLERNQLSGSVPQQLIARSENGSLSLSVGDNPNLCGSGSCNKKKNNIVVPIVASLGGLLIVSLIVAAAILFDLEGENNKLRW
ncbi:hypothetical protein SLA2020_409760 [Shorea laevis]